MLRDSFIFYRSFYEAVRDLPRDIQGEIYTAIMEYSLYGKETDNLKQVGRSVFTLIKPQLDANISRYENGKKGGRPKLDETEQKPNDNQAITKAEPNKNDNVNDNVNDNKNEGRKPTAFAPPSLEEVKAYFSEKGYSEISAIKAFNYYQEGNWKDSKGNKVKNWKQKMQGVWFKPENEIKKMPVTPSPSGYTPIKRKAERVHIPSTMVFLEGGFNYLANLADVKRYEAKEIELSFFDKEA